MNKVHPTPRKRNITLRYDVTSTLGLSEANRLVSSCNNNNQKKKLRRLPHIFAKVLELPFHSNADVLIQETHNSFRFAAVTDSLAAADDVRAHTIEIYPGVTKIVIRGGEFLGLNLDELELDLWRFRLPACTRPEMAVAQYVDGELVVVVPKGAGSEEEEEDNDGGDDDDNDGNESVREGWNEGNGRLILVQ